MDSTSFSGINRGLIQLNWIKLTVSKVEADRSIVKSGRVESKRVGLNEIEPNCFGLD